jgi:parallel beta-helix repeat protein
LAVASGISIWIVYDTELAKGSPIYSATRRKWVTAIAAVVIPLAAVGVYFASNRIESWAIGDRKEPQTTIPVNKTSPATNPPAAKLEPEQSAGISTEKKINKVLPHKVPKPAPKPEQCDPANATIIKGTDASYSGSGIGVDSSSCVELLGNTAEHNAKNGIDVRNSRDITIKDNQTNHNGESQVSTSDGLSEPQRYVLGKKFSSYPPGSVRIILVGDAARANILFEQLKDVFAFAKWEIQPARVGSASGVGINLPLGAYMTSSNLDSETMKAAYIAFHSTGVDIPVVPGAYVGPASMGLTPDLVIVVR